MRYLTHESEDPFWTRQGAKPHPLAKREAQLKAQTLPSQLTSHSSSAAGRNGSSTLGSNGYKQECVANGATQSGVRTEETSSSRSSSVSTPSPSTRHRSAASISLSCGSSAADDQAVLELLSHAERVGYKVSTV